MIGFAKKDLHIIEVYDENGEKIKSISVGLDDRLLNYTCSRVAVQQGEFVYLYDENGKKTSNGIS